MFHFDKNEVDSSVTAGPTDYDKEQIVGNQKIVEFKSQPNYTIPKSATHR